MRHTARWGLALAIAILLVSRPLGAQTSTALDPIGEAPGYCSPASCEGFTVQPFQDIVRAEVKKSDNVFRFVLEVAGRIPSSPPLEPLGTKLLEWSFRLDTDPTTFTHGFPLSPAPIGDFADIMVFVQWDGARFTASVIDRRPSLTGGEAVVTPAPLDIRRREISVRVDAGAIGDPPWFLWRAFTQAWSSDLGTDSWKPLDIAPSGEHIFARWPADLSLADLTSTALTSAALSSADLSSTELSSPASGGTKLCLVHSDCPGTQGCDTTTCMQPPKQCESQGTCNLCWGICAGDKSECKPRCHG